MSVKVKIEILLAILIVLDLAAIFYQLYKKSKEM